MTATHNYRRPIVSALVSRMAKRWWVHLLRGLAAIGFGVLAFLWPGQTLVTLVFIYGAFALLDGVLALIGGLLDRGRTSSTWLLVLTGILGVAAGALTLMWPGLVVTGLVIYVGAWAILRGIIDMIQSIQLRKETADAWPLLVSGLLSIAFGVLIFMAPKLGLAVIVWPVAALAVLAGIMLVGLALRLRGLRSDGAH
jgi:uncharacterized membrane protein HdeD (DUF308 family)